MQEKKEKNMKKVEAPVCTEASDRTSSEFSPSEELLLPEVELELLLIHLDDDRQEAIVLEQERVCRLVVADLPVVVLEVDARYGGRVQHVEARQLNLGVGIITDGGQDMNRRSDLDARGAGRAEECIHDIGVAVVCTCALVIDHVGGPAAQNS